MDAKAQFRSLAEPWADTGTSTGRLMIAVLGGLADALTDGANEAEALSEASDCLSTALAARIANGEDIPPPSRLRRGEYLIAPEMTMALKAALPYPHPHR